MHRIAFLLCLVTLAGLASGSWHELAPVPAAPSGVSVKDGGSLACMASNGLVYAIKGNRSADFYSYNPASGVWTTLLPVPTGDMGKLPKYGASIVADGDRYVYVIKGNNTLEFYRYDIHSMEWTRLTDVPTGISGKRVKAGDAVIVRGVNTNHIYLLKGLVGEFLRYSTLENEWQLNGPMPNALVTRWGKGSFLVYDGTGTIYAHKPNIHEFWAFDVAGNAWRPTVLAGMPRLNNQGKSTKSKDGACGTSYEGNLYAFKGGNTQQFWCYNPVTAGWTELETLPQFGSTFKRKRVKTGADLVNLDSTFYALKGNKTREFWTYTLGAVDTRPATEPTSEGATSGRTAIGESRMAIGPNPLTGGFATVRCNLPVGTSARLQVLDAAGSVVRKSAVSNPQSEIALDLRGLRAGVYLVELSGDGISTSQKLVIQQ